MSNDLFTRAEARLNLPRFELGANEDADVRIIAELLAFAEATQAPSTSSDGVVKSIEEIIDDLAVTIINSEGNSEVTQVLEDFKHLLLVQAELPDLVEEVHTWLLTQQHTTEDDQRLRDILAEHRTPRINVTAAAYLQARVNGEDVPLHVAADISQILSEAPSTTGAYTTFHVCGDESEHDDGWIADEVFITKKDAQHFIDTTPWVRSPENSNVRIVRRTTIEQEA